MTRYSRLNRHPSSYTKTAKAFFILLGVILFIALVFTVLIAVAGLKYPPIKSSTPKEPSVALLKPRLFTNDTLFLHQWRSIGTHNSYKEQPSISLSSAFKYSHEPIVTQLSMGLSHFELDLHIASSDKTSFRIHHIQLFDDVSNCKTLNECIAPAAAWSAKTNFSHSPIIFFLEFKTSFWESVRTYNVKVKESQLRHLETALELAWPYNIVRPSDFATTWPYPLNDANGKAIFVLKSSNDIDQYRGDVLHRMEYEDEYQTVPTKFVEIDTIRNTESIRQRAKKGTIFRYRVHKHDDSPSKTDEMERVNKAMIQMVATDHPPIANKNCCSQRKRYLQAHTSFSGNKMQEICI